MANRKIHKEKRKKQATNLKQKRAARKAKNAARSTALVTALPATLLR